MDKHVNCQRFVILDREFRPMDGEIYKTRDEANAELSRMRLRWQSAHTIQVDALILHGVDVRFMTENPRSE